ncbi:uncharacterized protein E0L32_002874 [Thyridium curvatum]|uniref:DUF6604 domain-containing protein n=1 Tax=Thyridium curvatum TaxID=1093900 RepID=A0A507BE59_9PEZI|nr:uncharacterized protein E0L32_002874 [Thyridium curvatum]TPX17773.1 hypothetical protein E0L32_002874 [Thyridium curvatum]
MLPGPLVSVYQQYKQDTDSVASWLASTAKACGFPADLLKSGTWDTPRAASGRVKGKARKEAKEAAAAGGSKAAASKNVPKYTVAIADFIPLAEFVAASKKPQAAVPEAFSATINRVIEVRSGFGDRLAEEGSTPDENQRLKHDYFVGVLEKVRDVLRSSMTVSAAAVAAAASASAGGGAGDDLANKFSGLAVYEPSQAFLDAPDIPRPAPLPEDKTVYVAEQQTTFADALFACTAMMNDLERIRSTIKWIWKNQKDGFFDLAAAAVATNTAIDLARSVSEDVVPLFKDHGGAWGILNKFFVMICVRKGYDMDKIFTDGTDNFNYDAYEIADQTFVHAYRMLLSFLDALLPTDLPLIKEGIFGKYDPKADRSKMTGKEKGKEDQILLMEFFTELVTVIRAVPDFPIEDEFLRGMREMDKTRSVPFYLVFAAQTYLDIHHILRDDINQSFQAVIQETSTMDNNLGLHLQFHQNLKVDTWNVANDMVLTQLQQRIKWVGRDPVYQAKVKVLKRRNWDVPESMKPHRILVYSPVISGLMLFRFRAEMYEIGITVANAWGSIQYTNHLYNALRQEKLLTTSWPDMEIVTSILGESNFFVGGAPDNIADYLRRFCLQMGVTVAAFTNRKKRRSVSTKGLDSRAGPRGIKDGVPVSSMFKDRYVYSTGSVHWTPEHVDDIVARSEWEFEGAEEDGAVFAMERKDDGAIREQKRAAQQAKKLSRPAAEGARMPLHMLVSRLALALQAETLEAAFPYLTLHRWCWRMLGAVRESCDPLLRELFTPAYMERESELPFVVGYIFMAAGPKGGGGLGDHRLLERAAVTLNELAATGGGSMSIKFLQHLGFGIQFETEEDEE